MPLRCRAGHRCASAGAYASCSNKVAPLCTQCPRRCGAGFPRQRCVYRVRQIFLDIFSMFWVSLKHVPVHAFTRGLISCCHCQHVSHFPSNCRAYWCWLINAARPPPALPGLWRPLMHGFAFFQPRHVCQSARCNRRVQMRTGCELWPSRSAPLPLPATLRSRT